MRKWLLLLILLAVAGAAVYKFWPRIERDEKEYVRLTVTPVPEPDVNSYQKGPDGRDVPCWPDVVLDQTWQKQGELYVSAAGEELSAGGLDALRNTLRSVPEGEEDLLPSLGVTQERVDKFRRRVIEHTGILPAELLDLLSLEAISERALLRVSEPEAEHHVSQNCVITFEVVGPNPLRITSSGPTRFGSLPWVVEEGGRTRSVRSLRVPRDLGTLLQHTLLGVPPGPELLGADFVWEQIFWRDSVLEPAQWSRFNELYLARQPNCPPDYTFTIATWRAASADLVVTPPGGPIAQVEYRVALEDGWADFDWDWLLENYSQAVTELEPQLWIGEWIASGTGRTVVLDLSSPSHYTNELYSQKRGQLHRFILKEGTTARAVVELYQKGTRCVVVEAGVVGDQTARPPASTSLHWLDSLYVSQRATDDHKHTSAEVESGYPRVVDVPSPVP